MQRCFRLDDFKIVGDPHLGRSFINGVPLSRRGERERMLKDAFGEALVPEGAKTHICMGDLFDKPKVSLETIMFAAEAYAKTPSGVQYYVLAGNHDISRDLTHVSALQIFEQMLPENVVVVDEALISEHMVLVPWSPVSTAEEIVREIIQRAGILQPPIAFGHWDLDGGSPNLIPIEALKKLGVKRVFNGHVHLPRHEVRDGVEVINVGSLQPLAHGEGNDLYVTITLDELKQGDYRNKCVRLRLEPGEVLDFEVDCLQLQVQTPEQQIDLSVDYDDTFNMKELINRAGENVPAEIWKRVLERL